MGLGAQRSQDGAAMKVHVVGGGLAGVEAACLAARLGAEVELWEMRPETGTPAHRTGRLAELVCSNSLKSLEPLSAPWLLKREMLRLGSVTLPAAFAARVPAGINLSVDRERFSASVEAAVAAHPSITLKRARLDAVPDEGVWILATGPLTDAALAQDLQARLGERHLYFYDAIAPIVTAESLDKEHCFAASRWGRGGADYINCPLDKAQYETFVAALLAAEKHQPHDFEQGRFFEGCLPIEELARRGPDTLRFGPMKPVGLTDPKTGRRPWACVQLRQENAAASLYNLVGFQTQLKWGEQERLLRLIPALRHAEFARFGSLHRNTYINAPVHLFAGVQLRSEPRLFVAGQLTGVEGYVESAASGLLAGLNAVRFLQGLPVVAPPRNSMLGALVHYLAASDPEHFQPVNAMWGLVEPQAPEVGLHGRRLSGAGRLPQEGKYARFLRYRERGIAAFETWLAALGIPAGDAGVLDRQAEAAEREAAERRQQEQSVP
jgi:methylenetetrahydrofolate--tRNA-(uracil-5-)-methyltransferase